MTLFYKSSTGCSPGVLASLQSFSYSRSNRPSFSPRTHSRRIWTTNHSTPCVISGFTLLAPLLYLLVLVPGSVYKNCPHQTPGSQDSKYPGTPCVKLSRVFGDALDPYFGQDPCSFWCATPLQPKNGKVEKVLICATGDIGLVATGYSFPMLIATKSTKFRFRICTVSYRC